MDEVGIVLLEHVGGHVPFLHHKLVWNVELVENEVEHVDIITGRLPVDVDELEGAEVPVADDNQRVLLGIAEVVGGHEAAYSLE